MKNLIFIVFVFLVAGCDAETQAEAKALMANTGEEQSWAFIQFNVEQEGEHIESYFYYAEVSTQLIDEIKSNRITAGFILLNNIRYWGNDDLIYELEDAENTGDIIFRIEDIVKLDLVKTPPIVGKGYEQYESESIEQDEEEKARSL